MKLHVNGIDIAYNDYGDKDAPVIMAYHSLATNKAMWQFLADELDGKYRIITPDARGHGESDAPAHSSNTPYDFKTLLADVTGLMDALNIERAHHVGLSMGGFICQHLGLYAPDRVKTLTLSSTSSHTPPAGQDILDERIAYAQKEGMEGLIDSTIARWFPEDFQESHPAIIHQVEQMISATPANGYSGWCHAIKTLNITDQLPAITAPVLITVGDEDPGTPVAVSDVIYNQLQEVEMLVVPDSSHLHPLQYPEEYAQMVKDLVEDYEIPEKDIWDEDVDA